MLLYEGVSELGIFLRGSVLTVIGARGVCFPTM